MKDRLVILRKKIEDLIGQELDIRNDKEDELHQKIDDPSSETIEYEERIRFMTGFNQERSLPANRMVDDQKYQLLYDNWDYITLDDVEDLIKRIGR